MTFILSIITVALLSVLLYQDFKYRAISWYLIPLLFVALGYSVYAKTGAGPLTKIFFTNLGFLILQGVLLTVYFSIKEKRAFNVINTKLGIGDILFFIVLCIAFSPGNFIIFYLVGLIVTLAATLFYHLISQKQIGEIPLAGCIALLMMLCISYTHFDANLNLMDDTLVLGLFNLH